MKNNESQNNAMFKAAQKAILEAVIYENWLRFYFLDKNPEQNANPAIRIPENILNQIARENPSHADMARELNGQPVEFARSRQALFNHIRKWLARENQDVSLAEAVLTSPEFQEDLDMFQSWLQLNAQYLTFMEMEKWLELFKKWKKEKRA